MDAGCEGCFGQFGMMSQPELGQVLTGNAENL